MVFQQEYVENVYFWEKKLAKDISHERFPIMQKVKCIKDSTRAVQKVLNTILWP